MREYKEKTMLPRAEIATRLRRIADEVERGSVAAGGLQVSIPDRAGFELELELDQLEMKIEWR